MANTDNPFGLKPIKHLNGNPWNGQTRKYLCEDGYSTALYIGDPVALTGTAPADDASGYYPAIQKATAGNGNPILGVIVSFDQVDCDGVPHDDIYRPLSTKRYANVCVDPDVIYIIQDDGAAVLTGDECTENAVLIYTHLGSTTTGMSGAELDCASDAPDADESNQLLILGVHEKEGNALGIHCIWEVIISCHAFRCQTGILGV